MFGCKTATEIGAGAILCIVDDCTMTVAQSNLKHARSWDGTALRFETGDGGATWGSLPGLRRAAMFQARRHVFMA